MTPDPAVLTSAIRRILGAVAGPVTDEKLCRLLDVDMRDGEHVRTLSLTLVGLEFAGVLRRTRAGYELVGSVVEATSEVAL